MYTVFILQVISSNWNISGDFNIVVLQLIHMYVQIYVYCNHSNYT